MLPPDGTVLAVNGADKDELIAPGIEIAVRTPELYDPKTGRWTAVADQARDRTYHSSAILLADGRVLVGGHAPAGGLELRLADARRSAGQLAAPGGLGPLGRGRPAAAGPVSGLRRISNTALQNCW